jgi:ketosteroid isomerase-like protein
VSAGSSESNVDVVRRLFETYRRGDYAEAAACLAPDVVYEVGQELPATGPDAVAAPSEEAIRARFAQDNWAQNGMLTVKSIERWTILLDGRR